MSARTMIRVADEVWAAARDRAEEESEWVIRVIVRHRAEPAAAERIVAESAIAAREERAGFAGEWGWARTARGIAVQIVECAAFEQVFGRFAAGLEERGLRGSITLHEPSEPARLPVHEHVIVCRARLRGHRVRHERAAYRWIADEAATAHVLREAEHWCRSLGGGARQTLVRTGAAEVSVGHGDAVAEQLTEDAAHDLGAACWSVGVRGFRGVGFQPPSGVCLVAGSPELDWRAAVEAFAALLREHAEQLEYAYVMRGWLPGVLFGGHLSHDWPERAGAEPRGAGWTSLAFEDLLVPDAFGLQLLGPGHLERLAADPARWRREPAAGDRALLRHADAEAWFSAPLVSFKQLIHPDDRAVPAVLADARRELAPVLHTPGAFGFGDVG
jgi:hypothetical protein